LLKFGKTFLDFPEGPKFDCWTGVKEDNLSLKVRE